MTELIVLDAAMYTAPTAASASTTSIRARPSFIPLPVAHDRPQSQRVYRSHRIQPFRLRAPSSEVSLQISSLYTNGTKILADDNLGGSQISGRQGSFTHGVLSDDAKPRFRLFSELPVELRLRIWGFAAPPPTVIDGMHYMQADMIFGTLIMPPLRAFPALLRVCSESRNAMLYKEHVKSSHPTYQISSEPLVVTSEGNLEHDCHHAQTYVSFGYDVPYLREILTSPQDLSRAVSPYLIVVGTYPLLEHFIFSHPPGGVKKLFVTFPRPKKTRVPYRDYIQESEREREWRQYLTHWGFERIMKLESVSKDWHSVPVEFIEETEVFDGTVVKHLCPEVRPGHERKTAETFTQWKDDRQAELDEALANSDFHAGSFCLEMRGDRPGTFAG